jgi:4-hydroxy-tetrahydrodipicolinate reductase
MGSTVAGAIVADEQMSLVAAVDPVGAGSLVEGVEVVSSIESLLEAEANVAVDFTAPGSVAQNIRWCLANGVHAVVGTTGMTAADLEQIAEIADGAKSNVLVAPNFAIGAVLMMRFAELAARFLPSAEIVELHHDGKADAPSGTAISTASRIAAARSDIPLVVGGDDAHPGARGADVSGVRVHSVRLPGLLAHQEVILGGPGQTLTIRHDATDRTCFIPGVLLAIRSIAARPGLTIGLDPLLEA